MGLVGLIRKVSLVGDPIDFPGFSAIVGERLFEVGRWRVEVGPAETDENGFVAVRVDGIELANAIPKFADLRRVEDPDLPIGPVEPPLMRLGIVSAECKTLNVARWAIADELIDLGAVVDLSANARAFVVYPSVGASERIEAATKMVFPGAEHRIEIVRAIARGNCGLSGRASLSAKWTTPDERRQRKN